MGHRCIMFLRPYHIYDDRYERVTLLLKLCGRAASLKNKAGQIPLQIALEHGHRLVDKTLVDLVRAYPESMDAMDEKTGKPIVDLPTAKRISKLLAQNGPHAAVATEVEPAKKRASQDESHDAADVEPPKKRSKGLEESQDK